MERNLGSRRHPHGRLLHLLRPFEWSSARPCWKERHLSAALNRSWLRLGGRRLHSSRAGIEALRPPNRRLTDQGERGDETRTRDIQLGSHGRLAELAKCPVSRSERVTSTFHRRAEHSRCRVHESPDMPRTLRHHRMEGLSGARRRRCPVDGGEFLVAQFQREGA